ncbi:CHAT domain-containing protein [Rhodoferax sp.]|uniref:CHAT domain-containing protein n=1 Tax=Rhodoferax sp. TaxID=50421 RepID=UPI0025E7F46A|nr:CHAT domain-containing protein [Rhodoferax sp.]
MRWQHAFYLALAVCTGLQAAQPLPALDGHAEQLARAVRQHRWGDAQTQIAWLQPRLPSDAACADLRCRWVQGNRLLLYKALGEVDTAYALALAIERNPAPVPPEATTWNAINLADLARQKEGKAEALQWLDTALARAATLPADSPPLQAARRTRLDLLAHFEVEDPAVLAPAVADIAALAAVEQQVHGRTSVERASLLRLQSTLVKRLGDTAQAARLAAESLAIAWATQEPELAWHSGLRLSNSAQYSGLASAQIFYAKWAVNAAQTVRSRTLDLPTVRQQSFMQDKREDYVDLADALLAQRRLPEAEQVLAMAREEDYHQLVRSQEPRRQRLAFTGPEQPLALALAQHRQHLVQAYADWCRQHQPLGLAEQPLQQALDASVAALLAAQTLPLAESPSASAAPVVSAMPTLQIPQVFYLPTPDRLRIAVARGEALDVVDVPVTEAALLRHIAALRRVLQNPAVDARPQAQALYALLWAPIVHLLPTGPGSVVLLHPEGALRYLPFATLHDGTHWLVEQHALALNAGGGVQARAAPQAPPRTGWTLLGSSRGVAGLPPLAQVPGELAAIRHASSTTRTTTTEWLDAAFTAPRLQAALAQRSVVHIASHFVLAPGDSRASWLQLGNGERVSLAALAGDAYRFDGLDLLTLSACDTAVPPGVDAQGRSLDSLAWLAHARGAKNVLASLWPVPDASTAALMGRFYQHLAAGQGKADALRSAQLDQLALLDAGRQTARGLQPVPTALQAPQNAVRHPYYWGAFVLLTEGR